MHRCRVPRSAGPLCAEFCEAQCKQVMNTKGVIPGLLGMLETHGSMSAASQDGLQWELAVLAACNALHNIMAEATALREVVRCGGVAAVTALLHHQGPLLASRAAGDASCEICNT